MSQRHSNVDTQPARGAPDLSDGPWQNVLREAFHRKVRWTLGGAGRTGGQLLLLINDTIFQKAMVMMKHLFGLTESYLFTGHVGTLPHLWGIRAVVSQADRVLGEGAGPHLQDRSQED